MTIRIVLPWPAKELSPNARARWAKAKAVTAARWAAKVKTLELAPRPKLPAGKPLSVSWLFCPPDGRSYDTDNMAARCKAYLDGVADALEFNDKLVSQTHNYRGEPCQGGRVELRLEVL